MKEKRRFQRTPFDGEAHLKAQGTLFNVEVLDLSLKGALITLPPVSYTHLTLPTNREV